MCKAKELDTEFPNITAIIDNVEKDFGYKELSMMNSVLQYLSRAGLKIVDDNIPIFLQTICILSNSPDAPWQQVL